jgi:hypothetical protein
MVIDPTPRSLTPRSNYEAGGKRPLLIAHHAYCRAGDERALAGSSGFRSTAFPPCGAARIPVTEAFRGHRAGARRTGHGSLAIPLANDAARARERRGSATFSPDGAGRRADHLHCEGLMGSKKTAEAG